MVVLFIAAHGARQVGQDPVTGVEAFAPATGGRSCPATSLKLVTPPSVRGCHRGTSGDDSRGVTGRTLTEPLCAILKHGLCEVMTTPNQVLCAGFDPALVARARIAGLAIRPARRECPRVSKVLDDFVLVFAGSGLVQFVEQENQA